VTTPPPGTTLAEVAAYLPPTGVPIATLAPSIGLSPVDVRVYQKFYGLRQVLLDPGAHVADLLVAAAKGLDSLAGVAHRVRYVIHARTVHHTGPYSVNPLTDVRRTLGLEHAVAFAVTQHACASGLLAVDLAGRLLADAEPDALALVLTGEKTYPHVTALMPIPTAMGEGAAACLVGRGGRGDPLLSYAHRTDGEFRASNHMSRATRAQFLRVYPQALAEVMTLAAERAGLRLADIDLVLPHNVNRISWVGLAQLTGYPVERIFLDNVPVVGHSFCADPFLNYASAVERDLLRPGAHYMLASVGLGATFAAMVLRYGGGR
jgi:3-oxoacyl-[acyl-carrier-protein] synthase-3